MDSASVHRAAWRMSVPAPSDAPDLRSAHATYEIPVVRAGRLARLRWRGDLAVVVVLLLGGAALAWGTTEWLRPLPVADAPLVRATQPLAPVGGFAVDAGRTGAVLRDSVSRALPSAGRATASYRVASSAGGIAVGADGVPVAIRTGRVVVVSAAGRAVVSVQLSRTPSRTACAAPCLMSGAAWTIAYRAEGVRVTVRAAPAAWRLGLGTAGRARIANDPVWVN